MRANLGFAFKNFGYEVIFICPYDKYSKKIKKHFNYIDIKINAKSINPIEDLKTIYRYYKVYKKINPDIVLQFTIKPNIHGTLAASLLKIPALNNIAGLGTLFIKNNFVTKVVKWLYWISQKKATKIFFQNQDDFEMFANQGLVQKEKCDVLPGSGVDIDKFRPVETEKDGVFRFLLASRMLWAKGIQEFVDAATILKEKYDGIEFQLLGQLDMNSPTAISSNQMEKWEKKGIIRYLGSSDDVRVQIAEADCVVLPSFYREGIPRILLEAASMQKPIITTDNVGCRNVVEDGVNGFLCEVKNVLDLADKMKIMFELPDEKRKSMGIFGREKIRKEFNESVVISRYAKTVKEILKQKYLIK